MKNAHLSRSEFPLEWRINTPGLLKEIVEASGQAIYRTPIQLFKNLLGHVAERASELNDPIMNKLMCDLALYGIADPWDKENYNQERLAKVYRRAKKALDKKYENTSKTLRSNAAPVPETPV